MTIIMKPGMKFVTTPRYVSNEHQHTEVSSTKQATAHEYSSSDRSTRKCHQPSKQRLMNIHHRTEAARPKTLSQFITLFCCESNTTHLQSIPLPLPITYWQCLNRRSDLEDPIDLIQAGVIVAIVQGEINNASGLYSNDERIRIWLLMSCVHVARLAGTITVY